MNYCIDTNEWIKMSERRPTEVDFVKNEWAVEFLWGELIKQRGMQYAFPLPGNSVCTHWRKVRLCPPPKKIECPFEVGDHIRLRNEDIHNDLEDMVITAIDETGASYKGAIPLSIPRLGMQGDGTGKTLPSAYHYFELAP